MSSTLYSVGLFNKLTSVFHASVPVIDQEFHHNIVKVAVDLQDNSREDLQTTLTMLSQNSGRKIAPNTGANATKFFTLATKS